MSARVRQTAGRHRHLRDEQVEQGRAEPVQLDGAVTLSRLLLEDVGTVVHGRHDEITIAEEMTAAR
jgi:hypothetical protein